MKLTANVFIRGDFNLGVMIFNASQEIVDKLQTKFKNDMRVRRVFLDEHNRAIIHFTGAVVWANDAINIINN